MLRKWANGFMWTAWVFVFITMLLMDSYMLTSNNEFSVMILGLIIAFNQLPFVFVDYDSEKIIHRNRMAIRFNWRFSHCLCTRSNKNHALRGNKCKLTWVMVQ